MTRFAWVALLLVGCGGGGGGGGSSRPGETIDGGTLIGLDFSTGVASPDLSVGSKSDGGGISSCVLSFDIPKTGSYTGAHVDPGLSTGSDCPDSALEPDDDSCTAVQLPTIAVDGTPLKLQQLAICPTGPNPKTLGHDVDVYEITVPAANALVKLTYDIQYGDLDLGIFRPDGTSVASDGTAVSNGCVATQLTAGNYYVVIVGANDTAVNRYSFSIQLDSATQSCN